MIWIIMFWGAWIVAIQIIIVVAAIGIGNPKHPGEALAYDLDRAGIERRNAEAVELVKLRAERDSWRGMYMLCNERGGGDDA